MTMFLTMLHHQGVGDNSRQDRAGELLSTGSTQRNHTGGEGTKNPFGCPLMPSVAAHAVALVCEAQS
jgi:hypothetical protein